MESNQDAVSTAAGTSLELVRFAVEVDNRAQRSQVVAPRGVKASFIFDPARVWGAALAEVLGASVGGVAVTRDDIADSLHLCTMKLRSGDSAFVMTSLVGQAALLQRLMEEAAAEYEATDRVDFKARRLANFLAIQRAHMKVLGAVETMGAAVRALNR